MEEQVAKRDLRSQGTLLTNLHKNETTGDEQQKKLQKMEDVESSIKVKNEEVSIKRDTDNSNKDRSSKQKQSQKVERKGNVNQTETKNESLRKDQDTDGIIPDKGYGNCTQGNKAGKGQGHCKMNKKGECHDEKDDKAQGHSNDMEKTDQCQDEEKGVHGHSACKGQGHDAKDGVEYNTDSKESSAKSSCVSQQNDEKTLDISKVGRKPGYQGQN